MNKNTTRQFLLVTLIHAETEKRRGVEKAVIEQRITSLFQCRSVIIARENHEENGFHYHIGIWNDNASKNTVIKKIREIFCEWDGRCIDVRAHKGWGSVCKYVLKEDKEPRVWGEYSLQQIIGIANAHEKHLEAPANPQPEVILKRLEQVEDWYQVYRDEILKKKVLTALPRMREAFEDLKVLRDIETTVLERIVTYLSNKGEPKEYDVEELKEKYLVIDWIASQICFRRPIKTKQLFIYGEPSTQKTLLFNLLSKVLRIYFASARRNDFTGANDYYDLWAFDEFHEPNEDTALIGATVEGTTFANNILKVLDGQECRLDSKYARVFKKKKNVPIVMIANKLPQIMSQHGPFRARFYRVRFSSNIENLEEERIVATLYGCIVRRACKSPYYKQRVTPNEVSLAYNKCVGTVIPMEEDKDTMIKKQNEFIECIKNIDPIVESNANIGIIKRITQMKMLFVTNKGRAYDVSISPFCEKGRMFLMFELITKDGEECYLWGEREKEITLLDFACIPIKKTKEKEKEKITGFDALFEGEDEYEEEENKKKRQQKESENEGEDEAYQGTRYIKRIFRDMRKNEPSAWSYIAIQRAKKNQQLNDYATWPLQIKIKKVQGTNTTEKKFPAIIIIRKKDEIEESLKNKKKYERIAKIVEEVRKQAKIKTITWEVSLTQNGEKETWNLEY